MTTTPFIVIEGPDGSGKSVQAHRLRARIASTGVPVHLTREPSDGRIGLLIRESLTGAAEIATEAMGLLYAADRIDHVTREVLPAIQTGKVAVCDRYTFSNLVYRAAEVQAPLFECEAEPGFSGFKGGCGDWSSDACPADMTCPECGYETVRVSQAIRRRIDWARSLSAGCPAPDLTVILSVTPETARVRRKARGAAAERYETDRMQVRCCSLYAIAAELALVGEPLVVLDANGDADAVAERVWQAVLPYVASPAGT